MATRALARRADALLACGVGPPARVRLLRDVLQRPRGDGALEAAIAELGSSPQVAALAAEQRMDGSWGRLHSRDTRLRQRVATTEIAVARALALGLDAAHPILGRAAAHLADVLAGRVPFPDPPERNDRWPTGWRLFTAATLARIEPAQPALEPSRRLWLALTKRTFASGRYDAGAEARAHAELTGASAADSYLVLDNRYAVQILASQPDLLPAALERRYFAWLWRRPDGLRYLGWPPAKPPPRGRAVHFETWLASLELLAALPSFRSVRASVSRALAVRADREGWWHLHARETRRIERSVRVLCLLARTIDPPLVRAGRGRETGPRVE